LKENADSLSKENTLLKNDISSISKRFSIINRVFLRHILKKFFKGKKSNVSYFHVFGYKCFVLKNTND